MKRNNKFMYVVAAALAAASAEDAEASEGLGTFGLQAGFSPGAERTDEGYLRTAQDYAIRIDRVVLDTDSVELSLRDEESPTRRHDLRLERVLELSQRGEHEAPSGVLVEDFTAHDHMRMALNGVFVEGRVFDAREGSARLPEGGVGISGRLPIEVQVRKDASDGEVAMAVEFRLPQEFFEGIDWEVFQKGQLD